MLAGLSKASFYRAMHYGIDAVNLCKELHITFPVQFNELKAAASAFESKNSFSMLNRCIGALDGWLCQIKIPSASEIHRIVLFFRALPMLWT